MRVFNITMRLLAGRTLWQILAVLLVIEAVFIAESFTSLLEDIVRYGGNALDVAKILILKMPEIVEFGLPLAVLLGVYFAVNNVREERELIVCAAAGASWIRIPEFAIAVGVTGFVVSLMVSGFVAPISAYVQRLSLAEIKSQRIIREIRNPGASRKVFTLAGRSFISSTGSTPDNKGRYLFTHHPTNGRDWHVSQAGEWSIKGPLNNGTYAIIMKSFTDYKGYLPVASNDENPSDPNSISQTTASRFTSMKVGQVMLGFKLTDLEKATDRTKRNSEYTLGELKQRFSSDKGGKVRRRLGEILARALLNPAAALLAIATVALSAGLLGRLLALPLAIVIILLFDMAGRVLLSDAALAGGVTLMTSTVAMALIFTLPFLALIWWVGEKIIIPTSSRA